MAIFLGKKMGGFFIFFRYWVWLIKKKVTKVTTEHKPLPKLGKESLQAFFYPKGKKCLGQSLPQELEEGPRSGLYLLVCNF